MKSHALAAAALAVGLVVAPAGAAHAAGPEPFKPSDSKTRAYMLNVLGSVLKGATPDSWRREILANQNRYNFGLESLDVALNGGKQMNGDFIKNPSSYDDYVIKAYEEELGKKPARPPATRAQKFDKFVLGAGGVVGGITSAQFGFEVGKGISQLIGHDPSGLCTPSFEDGGLIGVLTGTDCSAFDLPPEYIPNSDIEGGVTFQLCNNPGSGICARYTASIITGNSHGWCFDRTATGTTTSFSLSFRLPTATSWSSTALPLITSSDTIATRVGCRDAGGEYVTSGAHTGTAALPKFPDQYVFCGSLVQSGGGCGDPGGVVVPELIPDDPERTLTCSVTGDNGQTYTSVSEPYTESSGKIEPPVCPPLPPGVNPVNYAVTENSPAGPVELYNEPTTPEYQAWLDAFPQCSYGACATDLLDLRGADPVSCFDTGYQCADWFADPAKVDNYQCTHGGEPVDLKECYVYAVLFKPGQVDIGAPYADPETGIWSGGQSSPGASQTLFGNTVRDPGAVRSCYGQGWAEFNPVEWIMQPIQCALEWAFVPRPAVVALEIAKANESWAETPPGVVVATVGEWDVDVSLDGCSGIPLTWQGDTVQMLDACPGSDLAPMAATSHSVTGILFGIGGIYAVVAIVAGVIGYRGLTVAGGNH